MLLVSSMYPAPEDLALGVFVKRQVECLRALGVDIDLIVDRRPPRRYVFRKYLALGLRAFSRLTTEYDVVHVHWPVVTGVVGWIVARLKGRPLVVTVHGGEIDTDSIRSSDMGSTKHKLTKQIAGWVMRRADGVIVVGSHLGEVAQRVGVLSERISVINMGVDTSQFQPYSKEESRSRLGIATDHPVVAYVGMLTTVKGPTYLLRAMPSIVENHPTLCLYVVGAGQLEADLKNTAAALGVTRNVRFVGQKPHEEIPLWMSAADVVIMPSLTESFGLAALEAMACGTPVVASYVGGLPEQIVDGQNGFLVPPKCPEAIAQKVNWLLSNPSVVSEMRDRCVSSSQQYDSRLQATRVMNLYRKLVHNNGVHISEVGE